jgi:DNA repair protein RecN (Recombination protein N)
MPNAALQVSLTPMPPNHTGADHLEFLFDANRSGKWEPLKKVASGGELSRLMLCIKSLVAASMKLPTLIFDEIDSGISGEAARQVGLIMKELANNHQLICITHQPQIAGKADAHFWVYKESKGTGIHTGIRQLTEEERVTAIASMLSGEAPSAAALANAREMIRS